MVWNYHPDNSDTPYYGPNTWTIDQQVNPVVMWNISPVVIAGPTGSWRTSFHLMDSQGNLSNIVNRYSTVSESISSNTTLLLGSWHIHATDSILATLFFRISWWKYYFGEFPFFAFLTKMRYLYRWVHGFGLWIYQVITRFL